MALLPYTKRVAQTRTSRPPRDRDRDRDRTEDQVVESQVEELEGADVDSVATEDVEA